MGGDRLLRNHQNPEPMKKMYVVCVQNTGAVFACSSLRAAYEVARMLNNRYGADVVGKAYSTIANIIARDKRNVKWVTYGRMHDGREIQIARLKVINASNIPEDLIKYM
jgi:hypothetical protein